jgi:two-component system, OmpR family, response regulator
LSSGTYGRGSNSEHFEGGMNMRGVDDRAAEKDEKIRGVLVLTRNTQETDSIRGLARARGLDAVELEVEESLLGRGRRESGLRPAPWLSRGPITFEPQTGEVSVHGAPLALRRTERDVLAYLMKNAHRFVTPQELQEHVLKTHGDGGAARNQVYELRRKLRAAGHTEAIETRTHQGYRLRQSG